ncbi:MAG TPA: hypothetical protein VKY19_01430 [Ktedonosporobacter sp.]|jgi:hypothetical protein|nr:hypothetical protein [Ktedonosporobacter sp.]
MSFYPEPAPVPTILRTGEMLIRPLRASDVVLDYDAVISSRAELWLRSGGNWPHEGFTIEENLADLQQHEQEHQDRLAFTYTVMNLDETECLGCLYITPLAQRLARAASATQQPPASEAASQPQPEVSAGDAVVTFWVRQSRLADNLDLRLLQSLTDWFRTAWTFPRVTFLAQNAQQRQLRLFEQLGMNLFYTLPHAKIYILEEMGK